MYTILMAINKTTGSKIWNYGQPHNLMDNEYQIKSNGLKNYLNNMGMLFARIKSKQGEKMNYIKSVLLFVSLGLMGCQQLVPGRVDVVQSGTSTTEVTVSLRVIDQIKQLCTEQVAPVVFATKGEHDKAVADCVFEHLSSITTTGALNDYVKKYCQPTSDLSAFTAEQIAAIDSTCATLGM